MQLLVTRPREEAEGTAARLRGLGHAVAVAPMLRIAPVAPLAVPARAFDGILMTSGNAARMLDGHADLQRLRAWPVLAVGRRTAQAAAEAGFTDVVSAEGDAGDLARLAAARFAGGQPALLYLAGDDRARDLPGALRPHGIAVETLVVYRAEAASGLPPEIAAELQQGRIEGVLHFSQRTADIFLACLDGAQAAAARRTTHYCLSQRVAEPLRAAGWPGIKVAPRPDEEALLGLIGPG